MMFQTPIQRGPRARLSSISMGRTTHTSLLLRKAGAHGAGGREKWCRWQMPARRGRQRTPVRLLGGAFGAGFIAIVRGYTFISRCLRAGRQIFVAGFSRGAYTAARPMIAAKGLLDAARSTLPQDAAYRLGAAVA